MISGYHPVRAAALRPDGTHRYLSTHCLHGFGEQCAGACKFCPAVCVHPLHPDPTRPPLPATLFTLIVAHQYLSTACLHDAHPYCQANTGGAGQPKAPARCIWCPAPCLCPCHEAADR